MTHPKRQQDAANAANAMAPRPQPSLYSLNELLAIGNRQATEAWPAHEGLRAVEEGYRRGYVDGWRQGVEAMFRLMQDRRFSHMDAALAADGFEERELNTWRAAWRAEVLGHSLCALAFNEPHDRPPRFAWEHVRKPSDEPPDEKGDEAHDNDDGEDEGEDDRW